MERRTVVGPALRRARRGVLRRILASGLLALAAAPPPVRAQAPRAKATAPGSGRPPLIRRAELPWASDLAADASASRRGGLPILLFFDRDECPYCEQALREYLVPLSREEWHGRALFRQVGIDRRDPVVDFAGAKTSHAALAARYGVSLSPTVIVVDGDGRPIGEPIVGLLTVDFYGAYVDGALEAARRKLARN